MIWGPSQLPRVARVSRAWRFAGGFIGAVLALLVGMTAAFAFFAATDSGSTFSAAATGDSLPQGATPSAPTTSTPHSNTVTVTFAQAHTTAGHVAVAGYTIARYPAGAAVGTSISASCSSSGGITTCTETSVPDGKWQYTDMPFLPGTNWVGVTSGRSSTVTVDTTPPAVAVTYPVKSTTYGINWTGTITGTASDATSGVASAAVAVENATTGKWWDGTSFGAGSQTFVAATGTTAWSLKFEATNLDSGDTYTVVGQATDKAGNVGTSSTVTFTYDSSPPTVTVSYPADTTYGSDWSGSVTGSASTNSGSALTGVTVAIKDTTASTWWGGSSFNQSTATFVTASGASSWTLSLTGGDLTSGHSYTVVAKARDGLDNVGTSSVATFTYDISPPPAGTAIDTTNGGTAGTIDANDTLIFTFSEAMKPGSLLSGFDGSPTAVVACISSGTPNVLTLTTGTPSTACGTARTVNVGSVSLGTNGYASTVTWAEWPATMAFNAGDTVLTVTFTGGCANTSSGSCDSDTASVTTDTTFAWNPSSAATSQGGVAMSTAALNSASKEHF